MEQAFLILIALTLSLVVFVFSTNIYKKDQKKSIIPPALTVAVTITIFIIANIIGDWTGVFISLGGAVIGVAAILSSLALLMYHIIQKSQN